MSIHRVRRLWCAPAAEWTAANPLLQSGDLGVDLTSGAFKHGNGVDRWNELSEIPRGGEGTPGDDGADGTVWRVGAGVPDNATGVDGDLYLRSSNGDVYQRTAGVYAIVANIRGAQGDAGATTWAGITDKPLTFPSTIGEVVDLASVLNDIDDQIGSKVDNADARLSDARTPTSHDHDTRYYTQTQLDTALGAKADASALSSHSGDATKHLPAGGSNGDVLTRVGGVPAWAAPAAGSDGETALFVDADQQITVAGFVDIADLVFPVLAGKAYLIEAYIVYQSSVTTMGVLIGVNGPAAPTRVSLRSRKEVTAIATAGTDKFSEAVLSAYNTANPVAAAEIAANADLVNELQGVFFNGPNAGNFAMRFSKENVAGTATIKAGSWLRYRRLN